MTELQAASLLIQKAELFSALDKGEIDFIASNSGILNLEEKSFLFSPEEEVKHFYILISGCIRVFSRKPDGTDNDLAVFKPGDIISDFDYARGARHDAFAVAEENSKLIEFPGQGNTLDSLSREEPHIVCKILIGAIVMMAERIKSTRKLFLENISWVQELQRRAYEDPMTGLLNQNYIYDEIPGKLKAPAALIMLKPDRFKVLVDSRGHGTGDRAMIRIALILKNITRKYKQSWALRFKSNEAGLVFIDCDAAKAKEIAEDLFEIIAGMDPVPETDDAPEFNFSASISWCIWPFDDPEWESLFQGNYASLLDVWKSGGERIVHYRKND